MVTRSSPYSAEADDTEKEANEKKREVTRNDKKDGDTCKGNSRDISKPNSRRTSIQPDDTDDVRRNSVGLNNSSLAALKFCNSSEGAKLDKMSSNELKKLSKTLAQASLDAREIYSILVNFISNKRTESTKNVENTQRLSDILKSSSIRQDSIGEEYNLPDGDALTFYHSDTSREVSPTDPKFRTMSSISSPPLDSSSPKSSGSSIGVQTDSHRVDQVSTVPSSVGMGGGEGILVAISSAKSTEEFNDGSNSVSPKLSTLSAQARPASSSLTSLQYATMPSQITPPGNSSLPQPTSVVRKVAGGSQNNSTTISPTSSYQVQQTSNVVTSTLPSQQHVYETNSKPLPCPRTFNTGNYRPDVQMYLAHGYQPSQPAGIGVSRTKYQVVDNAVVGQFHQAVSTQPLDSVSGRLVSATSLPLGHAMPAQSHVAEFPVQISTQQTRQFVGTGHTNSGPGHVIPVASHECPVSRYVHARPKHETDARGHVIPENAFSDPMHALPVPTHVAPVANYGQTRLIHATDHAIPIESRLNNSPNLDVAGRAVTEHPTSYSKHAMPESNFAAFRPLKKSQTDDANAFVRQNIAQTIGNSLAQSCPAFCGPEVASAETYPRLDARTVKPYLPNALVKARTMSGDHVAVTCQSRHLASSPVLEAKPMWAPYATKKKFDYEDEIEPGEFRVVSDLSLQDGVHVRRPRGYPGVGQRQVWYKYSNSK